MDDLRKKIAVSSFGNNISSVTNLHPATAADTAILALHHCRALLVGGSSDAAATRAMTAFLLWARTELEAGRLIAVIADAVLKTTGSAVLHSTERPAPLERTELLFVYSTDPSLELDLMAALIAKARCARHGQHPRWQGAT